MANSPRQYTIIVRFLIAVLVLAAALAAVSLVLEWNRFTSTMPDQGWNVQVYRIIGLLFINLIFTIIFSTIALLVLWVRLAGQLSDLQGWHTQWPGSEFVASDADAGYALENYIEQEARVFEELDTLIDGPWAVQSHGEYSRYDRKSVCNPETIIDRNWNRTFVLEAAEPIGGVLLLHGLSDSPYSLRALGKRLHKEGYTVVWLRLPGHGTCPGALANITSKDWVAAVQVAMQGLRDRLPAECPMYLAGYSNGGALSVNYAIASLEDKSLPQLAGIMLFSPMIGISPMARITRLYHIVAVVSRNEKSQWSSIDAEIDPFKYSSWPMNANVQAWAMTQEVERRINRLNKAGRMHEMPPIIAMQSAVDSTVVVPKLITVLFDRLRSKKSELCLIDINRADRLGNLFNRSFESAIVPNLTRTNLPYRLTVVRNGESDTDEIAIQTRDGESWSVEKTGMSWPDGIVSLSHISVPIPSDDSIYGTRAATAATGLPLGTLSMRAEPSALLISNSLFVRCRYNPFYELLEDRVIDWLGEPARSTTQSETA